MAVKIITLKIAVIDHDAEGVLEALANIPEDMSGLACIELSESEPTLSDLQLLFQAVPNDIYDEAIKE